MKINISNLGHVTEEQLNRWAQTFYELGLQLPTLIISVEQNQVIARISSLNRVNCYETDYGKLELIRKYENN